MRRGLHGKLREPTSTTCQQKLLINETSTTWEVERAYLCSLHLAQHANTPVTRHWSSYNP